MSDKIALSLSIKATANLEKRIAEELKVEDPNQEKVEAILKGEDCRTLCLQVSIWIL